MSEEIVIKTETVKVEDLQGREKAIYDFAYEKAKEEYLDENKQVIARTIARSITFIALCWLIIALLKSCTQ